MEFLKIEKDSEKLKAHILECVKIYHELESEKRPRYHPGDRISYAGRVYDADEMVNLVDAALEFWLTSGRYSEELEKRLCAYLGTKYCHLCNSGSSANLLAFMALTSPLLNERAVMRGDEVITVAAGFPTTVAPILQYGAVPVFVDVTFPTYNIDIEQVRQAITHKTKAVMVAHTLGNPFDVSSLKRLCDEYGLWLIEDNCDALGAKVLIDGNWRMTGSIGHIGTSSFYPPHHMTTGEGGAVYTNDSTLSRILLSMRDWGRDCVCPSGVDNFCGQRFSKDRKFGNLPVGYDHKYVYSHMGYNLKMTDLQAAVGTAQINKLPDFVKARISNWEYLRINLEKYSDCFILPEATPETDPSWFGFMLTLKEGCGFKREDLIEHLEGNGVQTRLLFSGNLISHPCFDSIRGDESRYRVVNTLRNTDRIMNDSFWIGVYPGLTKLQLDYMIEQFDGFIGNKRRT